jgi:hypothetical protein
MPHDHVATKTAPTIPMIGSIQFQPNCLADKRAKMARTDVRAWDAMCRPLANSAMEPKAMPETISTTTVTAVTAMTKKVRRSPTRVCS